jgi:hypothetical protein
MTDTIPIENGQQVGVLVTSSISIFIVIVAVGLRLVAKKIANRIDYSDYCILAASVSQVLQETNTALTYLLAMQYRTTRMLHLAGHVWRIRLSYRRYLPTLRTRHSNLLFQGRINA